MSNNNNDLISIINRVSALETRVSTLETRINELSIKIDMMMKSQDTIKLLLQYVVTPLLLIVGGLVGVKVVLPS